MVRTKVFVGNLDFKTKEADLAKEFAVAGKVISANIITRGPRSLGYGFVEFDSEEDANNAVKLLNKKEIDARPVNVEVAKPREEVQANQQGAADQTDAGRGGFRGGRGGRGARGTRGAFRGTRGSFRGDRGGSPRGSFRGSTSPRGSFRGGRGTRGGRGGRAPRPEQDNRTPSKTLLFVANLPFKLDDAEFSQVFKDAGVALKNAYVVKNQRSGRSKGFGFAEFENEADQQNALTAVNKKVVDGRELVVKVALTEIAKKPEEVVAPTTTTTTTTATTTPAPIPAAAQQTEQKQ